MSVDVVTLRERPDLRPLVFRDALRDIWPEFMLHDATADLYFDDHAFDRYQDFAFAVIDPAAPEVPVGRAFSVPFAFGGDRAELPDTGWDGVIRWAHQDAMTGSPANALSALEISLLPAYRGRGVARLVLDRMRRQAHALGCQRVFASVRPTAKHCEPFLPMAAYVARRSADGLAADPWLRTHEQAGGRIVKIAPTSMVIAGTLAEWRRWTGLPLAQSRPVAIPGGLAPLHVSVEQDSAVYVEPNVWMEHSPLESTRATPAS